VKLSLQIPIAISLALSGGVFYLFKIFIFNNLYGVFAMREIMLLTMGSIRS
jgi:hypothetical protein